MVFPLFSLALCYVSQFWIFCVWLPLSWCKGRLFICSSPFSSGAPYLHAPLQILAVAVVFSFLWRERDQGRSLALPCFWHHQDPQILHEIYHCCRFMRKILRWTKINAIFTLLIVVRLWSLVSWTRNSFRPFGRRHRLKQNWHYVRTFGQLETFS